VRLIDLEPQWIHENVFVFRCPHCRALWLSRKNVAMPDREQWDLFEQHFGEDWMTLAVVPSRAEFAWAFQGIDSARESFDGLTVTPFIDASASGHWHGFITNGEIR
jgi:hypothetical protein